MLNPHFSWINHGKIPILYLQNGVSNQKYSRLCHVSMARPSKAWSGVMVNPWLSHLIAQQKDG
jgi:hypothetical protein